MGFELEPSILALLLFSLFCACAFEFVNGFHDTANAVATVIYTNSLPPIVAVVLSGILNFAGVFAGGITVAMGIVNLLPVETLIDQNINHSLAMIFALLLTAIIWNLGTWYLGLPSSSSHTLIGSILGVGLAFSFLPESTSAAVNWSKATEIGLSLLLSPLFGFGSTIALMYVMQRLNVNPSVFKEPKKHQAPPLWIRSILVLTCSSVSFSHGSNDGQKGVGLIMLILIGIVPTQFALDASQPPAHLQEHVVASQAIYAGLDTSRYSGAQRDMYHASSRALADLATVDLEDSKRAHFEDKFHYRVRKDILLYTRETEKLTKTDGFVLEPEKATALKASMKGMRKFTDYAPNWVILIISLSLGLGTMVGWRRIVKTIGEKIGKQHLTYAQGMTSEIVAASTIALSTQLGLPVSTTHVLSSGVAGSMVANKGLSNLQPATVRNIALAWLLTLPVTVLLSGGMYLLFRFLF